MSNIDKEKLHEFFNKLRNDKNIFEEFYNKYKNLIYKIAFSIVKTNEDSEEIVQNVFIKIYNLETDKLPTQNETSWLYSVTKNESLNFLKKNKNEVSIENIYELSQNSKDIEDIVEKDKFNRLISKLGKKEKEIVTLKIIGGFSFKEISNILNMKMPTVQWYYYKSINNLKIILGNIAMVIISFVLLVKANNNKTKHIEKIEEDLNKTQNITISDNNKIESENKGTQEKENTTSQDVNNEILEDRQNTVNEIIEIKDENMNNQNQIIIGFSLILLIVSITFLIIFIKNQQIIKKKLSKK